MFIVYFLYDKIQKKNVLSCAYLILIFCNNPTLINNKILIRDNYRGIIVSN
jgi:hypothetical protein